MEEFEQLRLWEEYEPQVNDYVIWDKMGSANNDEGWVYFFCDEYITIETGVRPKPEHQLEDSSMHKHVHTLLLCYESSWHQLKFIKKRESPIVQHYAHYDDRT